MGESLLTKAFWKSTMIRPNFSPKPTASEPTAGSPLKPGSALAVSEDELSQREAMREAELRAQRLHAETRMRERQEAEWAAMVDAEFAREAAEQLAATNKRDFVTQSMATLQVTRRKTLVLRPDYGRVGDELESGTS